MASRSMFEPAPAGWAGRCFEGRRRIEGERVDPYAAGDEGHTGGGETARRTNAFLRGAPVRRTLEGKVAIVTGAGSIRGIGRACAMRLARGGALVALADLAQSRPDLMRHDLSLGANEDFAALECLASEIEAGGSRAIALAVDVTDREQVRLVVEKTCQAFGGVDILVNNAGTFVGAGPFLSVAPERWNLSWAVNVMGIVHFCHEVLPIMQRRGEGSIVNIASLAGLGADVGLGAYTATKFAVIGLSKTIAAEFASVGIRCNAVCPGVIDTAMGNEGQMAMLASIYGTSLEAAKRETVEQIAAKRMGRPEEVAEVVAFLSGGASSYVTGAAITVAGGLRPGL